MQRVGINQCNEFVEFAMESPKAVSDERHEMGLSVQGVQMVLFRELGFFYYYYSDSAHKKSALRGQSPQAGGRGGAIRVGQNQT